jgi:hypothetical protein
MEKPTEGIEQIQSPLKKNLVPYPKSSTLLHMVQKLTIYVM